MPGVVRRAVRPQRARRHLRVATNAGFGFGRGIAIEGDVAPSTPPVSGAGRAVEADETGGDVATPWPRCSCSTSRATWTSSARPGRFGHDGDDRSTACGWVGDAAYVVTFLQTDPFWVVDLADPAAPAVVGELEIPGFSGYLHPITDDLVVGFRPDGNGATSARLFDVSDPQAPSVIDELALGRRLAGRLRPPRLRRAGRRPLRRAVHRLPEWTTTPPAAATPSVRCPSPPRRRRARRPPRSRPTPPS